MGRIGAIAVAAVCVALAWSWAGHRWAFWRLGEIASASGLATPHHVWFAVGYRALWHSAGWVFAGATTAVAMFILHERMDQLPRALLVVFMAQCVAVNLVVLQALPAIERHVPRTRGSALLLWTLLACVLWAAWHYAQPR